MPRYELNRLGSSEFESLVQALLKEVIGNGTTTFGAGPDGGREATFSGAAPYPSALEPWSGYWVFQAKYHDTELLSVQEARKQFVRDIDAELGKLTESERHIDNYIIATNVPLTPVRGKGTIDVIVHKIFRKYAGLVSNLHVWGADDINRFLEKYDGIRASYLHLLTPGALIARLLAKHASDAKDLDLTIRSYLHKLLHQEQNAQLDQAGDVVEDAIKLQNIFFELWSSLDYSLTRRTADGNLPDSSRAVLDFAEKNGAIPDSRRSAPEVRTALLLLSESVMRAVIVGGPGEGKTTVGQYLSQLHRATILGRSREVLIEDRYMPVNPRIPFRVALKDFAQWLSSQVELSENDGAQLDEYLCAHVRNLTRRPFSVETLHSLLRSDPTLIIFDGLDEVTNQAIRKSVLREIEEFLGRAENILGSDLQVLATTRPTGYLRQFDPATFAHLRLSNLREQQVLEYVDRWSTARQLESEKKTRLLEGIEDCLHDRQIALLMKSPLQVTILMLIINNGGTPPRQREALFDEYLQVIYKRERGKGKTILQADKELLLGLHRYIGYELQELATQATATGAYFPVDQYERHIKKYLANRDPYASDAEVEKITHLLSSDVGERLVLIVESTSGHWGFELRSIQEFFAACHLMDSASGTDERFRRLLAISRSPHWRNAALFCAGRIGRGFQGESARVVELCRIIDRTGPDRYLRRGARFALEIALDQALLPDQHLQRSLYEVAATGLQAQYSSSRTDDIVAGFLAASPEDKEKHLKPLISDLSDGLAPSQCGPLLRILSCLGPDDRKTLDLFDRLDGVEECQQDVLLAAFNLVGAGVSGSPEKLARIIEDCTLATLIRGVRLSACNPELILSAILEHGSAAAVGRLANALIRVNVGPSNMTRVTVPRRDDFSWYSTHTNSLIIVYHATIEVRESSSVRTAAQDVYMQRRRHLALKQDPPEWLENADFSKVLSDNVVAANEWLLAPLWCLHLVYASSPKSEAFVDFVERNSEQAFIMFAMSSLFQHRSALRAFISAALNDPTPEILDSLRTYIGRFGVIDAGWSTRRPNRRDDAGQLEPVDLLDRLTERFGSRLAAVISLAETSVRTGRPVGPNAQYLDEGYLAGILGDESLPIRVRHTLIRAMANRPREYPMGTRTRDQMVEVVFRAKRTSLTDGLMLELILVVLSDPEACDELAIELLTKFKSARIGIVASPGRLSGLAIQRLVQYCAKSDLHRDVRKTSARILSSLIARPRISPTFLRFNGFAKSHRLMAKSSDVEIQLAALTLIPRRKMTETDVYSFLTVVLPRLNSTHTGRLEDLFDLVKDRLDHIEAWTSALMKVVDGRLDQSIRGAVIVELERVLSLQSQSLRGEESSLSLPLRWHAANIEV